MTDATSAPVPADAPDSDPAPTEFPLTLEEFCVRKSTGNRQVEMVAGFYADEKRAGSVKDLHSAFERRFNDFANRPVK